MTGTAPPIDAPPPAAPATAVRSAMFVAAAVTAIDLLGFGIVLPLLPRIAGDYLGGLSGPAQGAWIGLLYSSFSLMQFVFAPVWGRVSDRAGRRPVLLAGLFGSVVFYALFGYASTLPREAAELGFWLLLLSRVGAGIAGASVSTAAAVIADCTTPANRAKGMGLIGAAFGIGFTFGPLIAWAGDELFLGARYGPGAVAAGLSAVALIIAAVILPETLPAGPKPPRQFFSPGRTLAVLKDPAVGPLVLIYFLVIFGFANFEGTLSLFTKSAFGLGERDNYLVFAFVGLVLMIVQGGIQRPLASRWPEDMVVKLGVALLLVGLGGLAAVAYGADRLKPAVEAAGALKPLFYLSVAVAVSGFAFVNPSVAALVSRRAPAARQGEVLGVNQGCAALGRILGPLAGLVAFGASEVLPYAVAAGVMVVVVMLLPNVAKENPIHHRDTKNTEKTEGREV